MKRLVGSKLGEEAMDAQNFESVDGYILFEELVDLVDLVVRFQKGSDLEDGRTMKKHNQNLVS